MKTSPRALNVYQVTFGVERIDRSLGTYILRQKIQNNYYLTIKSVIEIIIDFIK